MSDPRKVQQKKKVKLYKYPPQPMVVPVGAQPVVYPQPVMGQPKQIYAMPPQAQPYQIAGMQQIKRNPKTGNPIVAVPIGPPIKVAPAMNTPVMMQPQPMVTPPPVIVQRPVVTPPPVVVAPPVNQPPTTIIIQRYHERDDCSIF